MRPALYLAAALAVGIAAADWLRPHPAVALAAVVVLGLWAGLSRRSATVALLLTVAALGGLRLAYTMTVGRGDLGAWQGQEAALTGTVVTEPEIRKPRGFTYLVSVEQVGGHPVAGRVHVTQWSGKAPRFGERVEVAGRLKEPAGPRMPGGFDQAAYLARQGVYLTVESGTARTAGPGALNPVHRAAVATRLRLEGVLQATLPPREAALMAGLLFGSRADLPADIRDAFKTAGVFHLLAVSGGNVAMIIMPILVLLRRMGLHRRKAAALAIPVVIFFVFLTGASPSVLRAGLMAVLVLLGEVLRREKDALNTLGAAIMLLLLSSPGLLFDMGFQLSAGATLGILLFARPIEGWLTPRFQAFVGERAGSWLAVGLSVTFAAQLLVEPISLHHFGAFSAIAPLANLLVLAFLEPVVHAGSVAVLIGLVAVPAAWVLNWLVRLGLWLLVFLVKATAAVPGAYLEVGHLPVAGVVVWYCVLAVAGVAQLRGWLSGLPLRWRVGTRTGRLAVATCTALAVTTGYTWRMALADPPDTLQVTFLDVGQGDAILIQAPTGQTMLVDAGPYLPPDPKTGRTGYDSGTQVILPALAARGIKRLDYLVLTHADLDHAGGGPAVLQGISVSAVLKSDRNATEKRYLEALRLAGEKGISARQPTAGQRILLGRDVVLEVLTPPPVPYEGSRSDDNSNCIAFRLLYRQVTMLLACDLEGEAEEMLVGQGIPLEAHLLKVAHHGSGHSSTKAFLEAVRPRYAVLSVGNGNKYGHPDKAALDRLQQAEAQVYRTDRHGTVTAKTDGFTLSVTGKKGGPGDDQYRPLGLFGRRLFFAW